ncbi:EAL domain-containing protein [Burkholderia gladioli]|jgi:EAL domain-containing protein (putative c-di-GMP-specific phosphodiesterase class I)|uniref:EAL domain protein n=1 Tax=Burkholderia gladioli TaxID=28095 RepID=A0AAW3EQZ4_BURGA|nr:EAL domain-containing protein [Burkholderia gladioli]AJW97767.1 EAL domain protein [Burkholderia gladioli]ASD78550.1 EAL domain-containing protein [Burkholderia gladioli pv. gladioli]AWY56207.1 EAL domain-containing protein [Burkholderia gladioli pv. gladioli]KGC10236.1 EAL domain protein [Burkholderia gladioli]PRH28117.1 EAL domain-containing protein [Burkholderia gladioli]
MRPSAELTLDHLVSLLVSDGAGGWTANYRGMRLTSAFQPVLSITHRRIVGYEALVRAQASSDASLEPEALFALAHTRGDAPLLDRMTRCLHAANFAAQDPGHGWLFLNVMPQMLDSGSAQRESIDELCAHFSLPPTRVVLEVIEQPVRDEAALARTIDRIQHRDFLIAIDDFGTGFSNFDRVWQAHPDIVKLDRSLVERAQQPGDARRNIRHLVTMLHQAGALVLAEGIETTHALQVLMDADVDFVQGFLFGQPDASLARAGEGGTRHIDEAWARHAARREARALRNGPCFGELERRLLAAAQAWLANGDLAAAAAPLFELPEIRRLFVTDPQGRQPVPSIARPDAVSPTQAARLAPLFPDTDSNWSRLPVWQRAMQTPGRVIMAGPQHSLTEGRNAWSAALAASAPPGSEVKVVLCVEFVSDPHDEGDAFEAADEA